MGKSFIFCWNLFLVLWHNLQIKYIFIRSDQRLTTTQIIEINGKKILKRTYWFAMHTDFRGSLVPQIEEGITEVVWVDKEQIAEKLNNSFGNIKELLK